MATTTEAVRRLTYKVDSDDAVRRLGQVQSAQKGVTGALNENTVASEANEARTARLQTRYQALLKQQQAMQAIIISQATATASATNQMAAANDNYARSTSHVGDALRTGAKAVLDYAASWAATAGAVGAAVLLFGRIVSVLTPIIITYKLFKTVVDSAALAWELGGKQLEEYRQIAEKAAAVDLSTTFYQRLIKGAEAAKVPVEDLTRLLQNLQKAAADALGGSALEQRLSKHLEAGNFGGNAGVQLLSQANTTQQRFEAVVTLINKAMESGQRLAALDLAKTAFGPEVSDRLRQDSEYLDKIVEQSKKIAETELVSAADIGRAAELQARYDAAIKLLEQRWHPIQDLLTQLGVRMHTAWVGIVEAIAQAFDGAARLVTKIGEITPAFWDYVKRGANAVGNAAAAVGPSVPGIGTGIGIGGRLLAGATAQEEARATDAYTQALDRLRAGLQNTKGVQQAVNETATVANRVYGDNSKTLDKVTAAAAEQKDGFDRAIESAEKHIARMQADAKAVGLGAAALEEGRTRAMLWTAALQAGIPVVGEVAQKIDELAKRAAEAAKELAKARIDQNIKFQRDTIGLSSEDVQIAQQLSAVYPKVADALASVEAQQIRVTNAQRTLADGFRDVGKEMFTAFLTGTNMADAMVRSLDNLASKLANAAFDNILTGLMTGNLAQAGIGAVQAGASALISAFTSDQKAAKEVEEAKNRWKEMTEQVDAFNRAAAGVDLGPLTSQLMQLQSTYKQLALAALEARDYQAIGNLQETFNRGVNRTVQSFLTASPVVDDLGRQLTAVADEGSGLIEFLQSLGPVMQRDIDTITAAIVRQQQELRASVEKGLVADIRNNSGVGYLNTISDAIEKFNTMVGQGVSSGVSSAWLYSTAQAAINGAKLQGQAYQDLIALYPQLTRVTHEFIDTEAAAAAAAEAAARAEAIATEKLGLQLRLLGATTDTSTLAGQLAIFDAKARQEYDAAVAAGTVAENLGLLTQALAAERDQIVRNSEAALASAAAQKAAADATEQANLQLRLLSATTDSSTLQGALTLFDAKAIRERADAVAAGSANIALLDQALAAERLNIVNDFGQKAADAEKQLADQRLGQIQRIQQYLDNLSGGSNSTLAPVDRLAAARQQFNAQFAAARSGDQNALSNITQYSDNLLSASRDFYASSQQFQNDRAFVMAALSSLAASGIIGSQGSGIAGVTAISSPASAAPANTNSFSGVVEAVKSLEGKVVVLQAALKEAIDKNSQIVAQASVDEGEKLDQIAANTGRIPAAGNLALAMPG